MKLGQLFKKYYNKILFTLETKPKWGLTQSTGFLKSQSGINRCDQTSDGPYGSFDECCDQNPYPYAANCPPCSISGTWCDDGQCREGCFEDYEMFLGLDPGSMTFDPLFNDTTFQPNTTCNSLSMQSGEATCSSPKYTCKSASVGLTSRSGCFESPTGEFEKVQDCIASCCEGRGVDAGLGGSSSYICNEGERHFCEEIQYVGKSCIPRKSSSGGFATEADCCINCPPCTPCPPDGEPEKKYNCPNSTECFSCPENTIFKSELCGQQNPPCEACDCAGDPSAWSDECEKHCCEKFQCPPNTVFNEDLCGQENPCEPCDCSGDSASWTPKCKEKCCKENPNLPACQPVCEQDCTQTQKCCSKGQCVDKCPDKQCCVEGNCKDSCKEINKCCHNGECVDTCPIGKCCVDGICTDSCEEGKCCDGGICVDNCPPGKCCKNGRCVHKCGPDLCCSEGKCIGACPGEKCCANGQCQDSCPQNQCCIDGFCKRKCPADKCCNGGTCQETCDENKCCVAGTCGDVPEGGCCVNGKAVPVPIGSCCVGNGIANQIQACAGCCVPAAGGGKECQPCGDGECCVNGACAPCPDNGGGGGGGGSGGGGGGGSGGGGGGGDPSPTPTPTPTPTATVICPPGYVIASDGITCVQQNAGGNDGIGASSITIKKNGDFKPNNFTFTDSSGKKILAGLAPANSIIADDGNFYCQEGFEAQYHLDIQTNKLAIVCEKPHSDTVVKFQSLEEQDPDGPGTKLSQMLEKIGIKSSATCSCKARARTMNEKGYEWCEQNIDTIVVWLKEEATKRKLPFVKTVGKLLVKRAISLSKKAKLKNQKVVIQKTLPQSLEEQDPDGPGTKLSQMLEKIGIKSSPTCSCKARARTMNEKGYEWCEQNIETIVGWLKEEATKRKLPFIETAGRLLIKKAISLSKKAKLKK